MFTSMLMKEQRLNERERTSSMQQVTDQRLKVDLPYLGEQENKTTGRAFDNTLVPVMAKPRIQALDVIRGVSILSILAVNADGYAAPIGASLNPLTWLYPNTGATAIAFWVMDAFFHDKFVTLFSMLFGVSLFLVGGERSDKHKSRILWRRLATLMLFALLHGFGMWWGDILSVYACTGVLMFFCRSWRPQRLLAVGVAIYLTMVCRTLAITAPPSIATQPNTSAAISHTGPPAALFLEKRKRAIAATVLEARSSWAGAYRVNTRTYVHQLKNIPWEVLEKLSLMMIGLSLFKFGFLSGQARKENYIVIMVVGAAALSAACCVLWITDVRMESVPGEKPTVMLLSPLISLLYASGLILFAQQSGHLIVAALAAAGRMAFTNYLTQSILMTSVFYGGRGGLMGEMNRVALWSLVVGIWLLQLISSSLWLKRYDMGPFEWAWRCMTYGRRVPLSKTLGA